MAVFRRFIRDLLGGPIGIPVGVAHVPLFPGHGKVGRDQQIVLGKGDAHPEFLLDFTEQGALVIENVEGYLGGDGDHQFAVPVARAFILDTA